MAAVLLALGEPGERHALPNSRVMIHQPVKTVGKANAIQLNIHATELERTRQLTASLLSKATGKTVEAMLAAIDHDCYLSAAEAKEMGLVDSIGGEGLGVAKGERDTKRTPVKGEGETADTSTGNQAA
ncbi:MAG: hypothetical protein SGPRY_005776 [Prymnesium sp.]